MAWGLWVLARRPELQARLAAEEAEVLGGRTPTRADVGRLVFHPAVMREVLRLYSPVWALGREAVEADRFPSIPTASGTSPSGAGPTSPGSRSPPGRGTAWALGSACSSSSSSSR
jgi:hypothetical protein